MTCQKRYQPITRDEMIASIRYWAKRGKRPYLLARHREEVDAFARWGYVIWDKPREVPWKGRTLTIIEGDLTPAARSLAASDVEIG